MPDMTLGDLLACVGGSIKTGPFGTVLKAAEYSPEGVPVISVGEVGCGQLRVDDKTPCVGSGVLARLPEYVLEEGDVVFGRKGAVDRSAWIRPSEAGYFLGSDGIRVRFARAVDSRFMAYQLQTRTVREWLLQHAAGTTMASLNQPTLERIPLRVPLLQVQRGIAEVLGALDDKIAANAELANTANALIRARFEAVTTRAAGGITIGELASQSKELVNPASSGSGVRYVGLEHVPRRSVWLNASGFASDVTSTKFAYARGDVLFGKLRPYFHKVVSAPSDGICSTDILVIRANDADLSGFVLAAASSDATVERATASSEGTRMPRTSWKDLGAVCVPWPGELAAKAFSCQVDMLRYRVEAGIVECGILGELRDALLPQLMSGKIRIKDAERAVGEVV